MAQVVAVPSPSSAMKRRRKEEVYRLAYINCIKPVPFRNVQNLPPSNGCLEEKSIAELIHEQKTMKVLAGANPYEVVRKPPKKRKKVEENCFVNEALNLAQSEPIFNPYEVKRLPPTVTENFEKENHSFVNLALNLKAPEHQMANPFEIVRPMDTALPEAIVEEPPRSLRGIENPALDVKIPMAIAVPFTPTINHRIDFSQLKTPEPALKEASDTAMTPSEMLSKKLVFSPKEQNCGTPKRLFGKSLSTISEEAVDIDQELECYQQQLENSINEAKLNNRKYFTDIRKDVLKKTVTSTTKKEATNTKEEIEEVACGQPRVLEVVEPNDGDFAEEDDDSFDLDIDHGNYQPFKRAYVRPETAQPAGSNDLMPPPALPGAAGSTEAKSKTDPHDGLKGMIRRSIRMITHPKTKKTVSKEDINSATSHETKTDIMSSIRRSLRKRKCQPYPPANLHDISVIIDDSRSVFKDKAFSVGGGGAGASNATTDKPVSIPVTSGIRNSIRRGKNNLMKNILHKKAEDYNF